MAIIFELFSKIIKCTNLYLTSGRAAFTHGKSPSKSPYILESNRKKSVFYFIGSFIEMMKNKRKSELDPREEVVHNIALATIALKVFTEELR